MKTLFKTLFAMTAAALLLAAPASQAQVACGPSQRVSDADADCMDSQTWESGGFWNRRTHFKARNQCPDFGKVVVKVDIEGGTDKTWHLIDGEWKEDSVRFPSTVESVTCCSDLSDLCSKSDMIHPQGCKDEFKKSAANDTCTYTGSAVHGEHCEINAKCESDKSEDRIPATATLHFLKVKHLQNCNGTLNAPSC